MSSAASAQAPYPPAFLKLAGHPVRWAILHSLARSDRRVGELSSDLGLPQNLVSYHLSRLRAERLVSGRRSQADGRDCYYRADLGRCGELLSGSGAALHPGLALAAPPPLSDAVQPRDRRLRVLFLCTGNSARSQMAEALLELFAGDRVQARSAGSHPKPLHANAVKAMRTRGLEIGGRRSKHLSEFTGERFDQVVSLCDRVREVCLEFPGHPELIHWSIPDPAREAASDRQSYPAFERTAQELETRIPFLLELLAAQATDRR